MTISMTTGRSEALVGGRQGGGRLKGGFAAAALLGAAMILGTTLPAGTAQAATEVTEHVRAPLYVQVRIDSLSKWLDPSSQEAASLIDGAANRLKDAAKAQPGRVVVLRYTDVNFQFDRLTSAQRQQIKSMAGGADPARWYWGRMADLTSRILARAREGMPPMMLSVHGLPLEETNSRSREEVKLINQAMRAVIDDIEAFVVPRSFISTGGRDNEALSMRRALPVAFKKADGRPLFYKTNDVWHMVVGMDGPLHGAGSTTQAAQAAHAGEPVPVNDPMAALQAAWGSTNSEWDLNGDGIVDIDDLTILVLNYEQYVHGNTGPVEMGTFDPAPNAYVIGSGQDLTLTLGQTAPANANVVFQTWSDVTESIEADVFDGTAPFVYPASELNTVTPGGAQIQALIRDSNNQIQATIRLNTVIALPDEPTPEPNPNDSAPEEEEEEPTPPSGGGTSNPPAPPPPTGGSGSGSGGTTPPGGGVIINPDAPTPTPVIKALSLSGMAPFTVHVHGLNSTLAAGTQLTARYEWDFGDTTSNSQYNNLVGWNVAHVYDTPGTYTIRLRVINEQGGAATATATVNVANDTRTTIYVSPSGSDSNPGTSSQPIKSISRAAQMLTDNMTVLFKRASTFDISGRWDLGNHKNVVLGAYGNGAPPVFNFTSNAQYVAMIDFGQQARDVTIQDIEFDSPFTPNNQIVSGVLPWGTNITVRRCHFDDVAYAFNAQAGPVGLLTMNNTTEVIGAYYCWVQGSDIVHLGNTVGGSVDEHNIRLGGATRVYIGHNDLTNHAKSSIWTMLGDHVYIAANKIRHGRILWGPNYAAGGQSERTRWYVAEGNEVFDEGVIIYSGAEQGVFRNNILHSDNHEAFSVWGYYPPMNRTVSDVAFYNNTAIDESGTYGRFVKTGDGTTRLTFANNLYVSPSMNAQNGSVNAYVQDSTLGNMSFKNNMWSIPHLGSNPHLLATGGMSQSQWEALSQVSNETYRDFGTSNELDSMLKPMFPSNTGQAKPGVMVDFYGKPRALSGAITVGAVQN